MYPMLGDGYGSYAMMIDEIYNGCESIGGYIGGGMMVDDEWNWGDGGGWNLNVPIP